MDENVTAPKRAQAHRSSERIWGATLQESLPLYRKRVGLRSHQSLADAAGGLLPPWIAMNRRLVQGIETGEYTLGDGVNELQIIALAQACMIPPSWLGVEVDESVELSKLEALLTWVPKPGGGDDKDPDEAPIRFDRRAEDRRQQGVPDSRCLSVMAGQAA